MKALTVILLLALIYMAGHSAEAQPASHAALNAQRYREATVPKHRVHEVQTIVARIERNKARYAAVSQSTGVPAHVIASLHNMEAGGSFLLHLHEGSSLKWRTKYVPKGRPLDGTPPFSWEYSAKDALFYDKMHLKIWSDLGASLNACEDYNGSGYRRFHPETPTPYLYAATSVERPGKYISDGKWSPTARSSQVGIAAIWKVINPHHRPVNRAHEFLR
jgi:lysozyme family protein